MFNIDDEWTNFKDTSNVQEIQDLQHIQSVHGVKYLKVWFFK